MNGPPPGCVPTNGDLTVAPRRVAHGSALAVGGTREAEVALTRSLLTDPATRRNRPVGRRGCRQDAAAEHVRGEGGADRAAAHGRHPRPGRPAAVPMGAVAHLLPSDVEVSFDHQPLHYFALAARRPPEGLRSQGPGEPSLIAADNAHLLDPASAGLLHHIAGAAGRHGTGRGVRTGCRARAVEGRPDPARTRVRARRVGRRRPDRPDTGRSGLRPYQGTAAPCRRRQPPCTFASCCSSAWKPERSPSTAVSGGGTERFVAHGAWPTSSKYGWRPARGGAGDGRTRHARRAGTTGPTGG